MKWTCLPKVDLRPAGARVLSQAEAEQMIETLGPGESMVWYCGYLPIDRLHPRTPEAGTTREQWQSRYARERAVEKLARFMLRQGAPPGFVVAVERGGYSVDGLARGQLSQRRLGPLFYEYLFTRSA
ncbi:MAG: hypothetical protein AB7O63_15720 [Reyranellaceae bacterium]